MDNKRVWFEQFEELLWKHHTCDWDLGNRIPDFPYQLATAYFNSGVNGKPEESANEAFVRYLKNLEN